MKNKDIEKWEKTKEEKEKIEEYRTRKKRLVYRLIIFSGFIILTAYLMYNGFYIIGSILLLIAFLFYYEGEVEKKENKKREKIKAIKKEEKLKRQKHIERLKVDPKYAKLHKEKVVDCDDGVSRIVKESSTGIIIRRAYEADTSLFFSVKNAINHSYKIKVSFLSPINGQERKYVGITIFNEKWFSEQGVSLNVEQIIKYYTKKKLIEDKLAKKKSEEIFSLVTLGPGEDESNYRPRLICINGFMFEKYASTLRLFSGILDDTVLIDGLTKENFKEQYTAATGKSEKEFQKFWETRIFTEITLSNVKKNNEQYAFPKEALTIIDELTYIREEKKIFNGYEIIETFDDGKPKKIVKYKDGKRTNEYKEHPFDLNPPKP